MNKFKRPAEYPAVSQAPIQNPIERVPVESPKPTAWECIGCPEGAAIIHKGTGYCRACYEKRNLVGTLIE